MTLSAPGVTRRDFAGRLGRAVARVCVSAAALLAEGCARVLHGRPPNARFATTIAVAGLARDGDSLVVAQPGPDGAGILIVRRTRNHFVAWSMQCTHEGCPLNPPAGGLITCPCHGSQFDLQGHVHKGPARFPLGRYDTAYDARTGQLRISLPADAPGSD